MRKKISKIFLYDFFVAGMPMLALFVFDFVINIRFNIYEILLELSAVMHFAGGFVSAWSIWRFARLKKRDIYFAAEPRWFIWLFLISLTGLIGIAWEVYEFFLDMAVIAVVQPSVADTVADLTLDLAGAAVFCLCVFYRKYRA